MANLIEDARRPLLARPTRAGSESAAVASPGPMVAGPPVWDRWEQPQGRFAQSVKRLFITPPRFLMWIVRAMPAPKLFWVFVGRYDEVLEVLHRSDVFGVPFSKEIARLNDGVAPGTQFLLGEDDRAKHDDQLRRVMQAFPRDDIARCVVPLLAELASKYVGQASHERFDVMQGLITKLALDLCTDYFGVAIGNDPFKFACAVFTVSEHLFGKPPIEPDADADKAAAYLRYFVDRAIDEAVRHPIPDRVVTRLIESYPKDGGALRPKDRLQVRAILMDMIVALVPNNTMVGEHILEVLLKKPRIRNDAELAAWSGDDARLECVLFEALRFMPLNPGPFRVCKRDYVLAEGTRYEKLITKGSTVMPLLFSAMFDPRHVAAPREYDPARAKSDQLHFSVGMHSCVGILIARAHITQTFKALLRGRMAIRPAPGTRLQMRSVAPVRFEIASRIRKVRPKLNLDPDGGLA